MDGFKYIDIHQNEESPFRAICKVINDNDIYVRYLDNGNNQVWVKYGENESNEQGENEETPKSA